jgi:signal transduction histidine kinase
MPDTGGRSAVGWIALFGFGTGSLLWHASTVSGGPLRTRFFTELFPLILSAVLIVAVAWLTRQGLEAQHVIRLAGWCLLGAFVIGGATLVAMVADPTVFAVGLLKTVADAGTAGGVVGLVVGVYDLHQRLSREEALVRERQTRLLNERLTVLNRVLRHDVRNDVNAILGYAELARAGEGDVDAALEVIEERARQIQKLSRRGRDIEALLGGDGEQRQTVDLAAVVGSELAELESDTVGVQTQVDVPDAAMVRANPMIDVAVENLVENAVEHAVEPTVELTVRLESVDSAWVLTIADNGPGIPEAEIRILERGEENQLRHSSGLGLWLVHWIVRESGGTITFEENDPTGSIVTIRLTAAETGERNT